jgi:hypothetical protein
VPVEAGRLGVMGFFLFSFYSFLSFLFSLFCKHLNSNYIYNFDFSTLSFFLNLIYKFNFQN